MSQSAKDRRVLNFRRSYSSEDETEPRSGVSERLDPQVEPAALQLGARAGPRLWCSAGLAVLASAAAMAAAGCFCALTYPIIKGMRLWLHALRERKVKFQATNLEGNTDLVMASLLS